jgi:hypothetical protein
MARINNPSLRLTPRHEPGDLIPTPQETSILDWLEASGRMMPREELEEDRTETEEEITDLVDNNFEEEEESDEEEEL